MEKKQDIDIEKIKEKLRDDSMNIEWNKERVWNRIDVNEEEPKVLFPFWKMAATASVLLIANFGLWLFIGQKGESNISELKTLEAPVEVEIPINAEVLDLSEEVLVAKSIKKPKVKYAIQTNRKSEVTIAKTFIKRESLELASMDKPIKITSKLEAISEMENVSVSGLEVTSSKKDKVFPMSELKLIGQKITLIIPEEEEKVKTGLAGFVQRVGKFNQTGEWETKEKESKNTLWAKFIESTKTATL